MRLAGGSADPDGGWEYGRLEIVDGGAWGPILSSDQQGRFNAPEAHVACKSLGYETGSPLVVGGASPFPEPRGGIRTAFSRITCDGSEDQLSECAIDGPFGFGDEPYDFIDNYAERVPLDFFRERALAVVCATPSGMINRPVQQPKHARA